VYKQPTLAAAARIYTSTFRIYGDLHLPPQADVAGLLNNPRPYLPVTNCRIYRHGVIHPPAETDLTGKPEFVIIPKDSVLWVTTEQSQGIENPNQLRNLYLLYPDTHYVLKGDFPIATNVRISDFLVRAFNERSFHYLYNAELRLVGQGQDLLRAPAIELFSIVTVNLKKVAGVFDVAEDSSKPKFLGF
jgi:hypothetical protein